MKTLNKIGFKDIPVGDVFAMNSCWVIWYKISEKEILCLDTDYPLFRYHIGEIIDKSKYIFGTTFKITKDTITGEAPLYKLPKSVQRLWKVE